jgi:predicted ATPase
LALAHEFDHAFSTVDVLCFAGCVFNEMRRDASALKGNAQELARLSEGMGFSSFLGTGACYLGEALAEQGQAQEGIAQIREGIAVRQSVGARCYWSGISVALAVAQTKAGRLEEGQATLSETLALVQEADERYYEAELHRRKGELQLMQRDEPEAEASFQKAIEVARRQQAKSWELRAAISLSRLWQSQGRKAEAHRMLSEIYDWFTEGFDTPDLQEAKALIKDLAQC